MIRDKGTKGVLLGALVALLIMLPIKAIGGVPSVKDIMVTDVTTRSFSVIWASSEPSYPDLNVYDDPDGTIPTWGAVITSQPVESGDSWIGALAEDNGVMKVRVTGLLPNTTYYFQTVTTSKSTSDTTIYPDSAPLRSVTTEALTVRNKASGEDVVPFSNDLIVEECYLNDGVTPAEGTLLVATVEGGDYPVTAFIGDGIDPPYALIDLNNLFSRNSHESLDVTKGENLTLVNFRGMLGNSAITYSVPEDLGLSEIKLPDPALLPGWNMISFPLEPEVTSTETVLAPIWDKFSSIWAYDAQLDRWFRYDRFGPPFLNDLLDLHCCKGYWIVMNEGASLKISGQMCDEPIPIYSGWNLVGYHSMETQGIPAVLDPIASVLECIWSYETGTDKWRRYCPGGPPFLNDLEWVEPGKAYWINATGNGNW
ncbi:hypothetical protein DRO34_06195 [Candidatus Bathyarchaeota archaeon]|nr:MAG: hypothetical protein DRO34_06195 [Candidatus Bathyarchaeota archaeon]